MAIRTDCQSQAEQRGGGSSRPSGWAIPSWLTLLCLCCNPARPQQVKNSVSEKAAAENRNEIHLALARKTVNQKDCTGREKKDGPS